LVKSYTVSYREFRDATYMTHYNFQWLIKIANFKAQLKDY